MASARASDIIPANRTSRPLYRPHVFDVRVDAQARLTAGVLGLTVLVRHDSRRYRFAVTSSATGSASSDGVATTIMRAIEQAFGPGRDAIVVEEVVVLLRSGSLPIAFRGTTFTSLLPLLQRVAGNIVTAGSKPMGSVNLC
jgi:hypothetical protein